MAKYGNKMRVVIWGSLERFHSGMDDGRSLVHGHIGKKCLTCRHNTLIHRKECLVQLDAHWNLDEQMIGMKWITRTNKEFIGHHSSGIVSTIGCTRLWGNLGMNTRSVGHAYPRRWALQDLAFIVDCTLGPLEHGAWWKDP